MGNDLRYHKMHMYLNVKVIRALMTDSVEYALHTTFTFKTPEEKDKT